MSAVDTFPLPETVKELAQQALFVIEHDGWYKGALMGFGENYGKVCLLGAINTASSRNAYLDGKGKQLKLRGQLISKIYALIDSYVIPVWNDRSERKKKDVVDVLNLVINQ